MQLSAANLLLAAQQAIRPAPQPKAGAFTAELSGAQGKDDGFAPLDFKQTAEPAPQSRPAPAQTTPSRPGAALDIRV
jgi:hypothetical protein